MKVAAARVIKASEPDPPSLNRMRKTSAFLRKLSPNAEKNWHQNSGAKRRDSIRGVAIGSGPSSLAAILPWPRPGGDSLRRVTGSGGMLPGNIAGLKRH